MANHIRQQIREQFATQITGLTTTGSNVHQSRVYNLETGDLPAIIVYTKSEDSEPNQKEHFVIRSFNVVDHI